LQKLLTFCRTNKGRVHFVVVFNLTRFARDKYDHFALRSLLQSLGISLRSATEPIDDTSTGKLMEGVLAAFAQFDNDVRSDRTRADMKAALEIGRWVFLAPIGYLNAPRAMGKSLMADPERAPLVRRAFEEYATGRFTKQQLLKQVKTLGPDEPSRKAAHVTGDRHAAAQSAVGRHRGRARTLRAEQTRGGTTGQRGSLGKRSRIAVRPGSTGDARWSSLSIAGGVWRTRSLNPISDTVRRPRHAVCRRSRRPRPRARVGRTRYEHSARRCAPRVVLEHWT